MTKAKTKQPAQKAANNAVNSIVDAQEETEGQQEIEASSQPCRVSRLEDEVKQLKMLLERAVTHVVTPVEKLEVMVKELRTENTALNAVITRLVELTTQQQGNIVQQQERILKLEQQLREDKAEHQRQLKQQVWAMELKLEEKSYECERYLTTTSEQIELPTDIKSVADVIKVSPQQLVSVNPEQLGGESKGKALRVVFRNAGDGYKALKNTFTSGFKLSPKRGRLMAEKNRLIGQIHRVVANLKSKSSSSVVKRVEFGWKQGQWVVYDTSKAPAAQGQLRQPVGVYPFHEHITETGLRLEAVTEDSVLKILTKCLVQGRMINCKTK